MSWDSKQYLLFAEERTQPCRDLINMLGKNYGKILDLGCGPANSTRLLKSRFPTADAVGFDADSNMLLTAREKNPDIEFIQGLAPKDFDRLDRKFDLVFSNACIHWIENQQELIDGVRSVLSDGGTFAVQIPLTAESEFYRILYSLIAEKWPSLADVNNFHNLNQTQYYNILSRHFGKVTIKKIDYYHLIDSKAAVIEWYKGSGLRPYLERLSESDRAVFLSNLQGRIDREYKLLSDGKLFLIMPRLFFVAED